MADNFLSMRNKNLNNIVTGRSCSKIDSKQAIARILADGSLLFSSTGILRLIVTIIEFYFPIPTHAQISTPRHLQELTQQSLKSMLQKQRKVYDGLSVEFSKEPAEKVEKDLRDCENIIKILEEELAAKTPAIDIHLQTTSSNIKMLTGTCV